MTSFDIVMCLVALVIGFMISFVVFKMLNNRKADEDSIWTILNDYKEELIEIGQLCINILSVEKDNITREEYNKRVMDMTADYFRVFLSKETKIPKFIIDSITGEHMMDLIEYIESFKKESDDNTQLSEEEEEDEESENKQVIPPYPIPPNLEDQGIILGDDEKTSQDEIVDISKDIHNIINDDFL